MDEKNFDTTRAALIAVGFNVTASSDDIWASRKGFSDPNAYHLELYNQGRVRRGLEKFK
jgi:hypothetical protein